MRPAAARCARDCRRWAVWLARERKSRSVARSHASRSHARAAVVSASDGQNAGNIAAVLDRAEGKTKICVATAGTRAPVLARRRRAAGPHTVEQRPDRGPLFGPARSRRLAERAGMTSIKNASSGIIVELEERRSPIDDHRYFCFDANAECRAQRRRPRFARSRRVRIPIDRSDDLLHCVPGDCYPKRVHARGAKSSLRHESLPCLALMTDQVLALKASMRVAVLVLCGCSTNENSSTLRKRATASVRSRGGRELLRGS